MLLCTFWDFFAPKVSFIFDPWRPFFFCHSHVWRDSLQLLLLLPLKCPCLYRMNHDGIVTAANSSSSSIVRHRTKQAQSQLILKKTACAHVGCAIIRFYFTAVQPATSSISSVSAHVSEAPFQALGMTEKAAVYVQSNSNQNKYPGRYVEVKWLCCTRCVARPTRIRSHAFASDFIAHQYNRSSSFCFGFYTAVLLVALS